MRHVASLSRDLQASRQTPALVHSLYELKSSALSLAVDDHHIYCGSQNHDIAVWNKASFTLKHTLQGHTGSVLALELAEDKNWLFSASGDSTIRVWSTTTLLPIYVICPYLETGAGDLFSLAWSSTLQTIFVGCQNTSLQWYTFTSRSLNSSIPVASNSTSSLHELNPGSGTLTPGSLQRKAHKFFDSYPLHERRPADIFAHNSAAELPGTPDPSAPAPGSPAPYAYLHIPASNVVDSAHYGYIYSMAAIEDEHESGIKLVTGAGDETVKVWNVAEDVHTPDLLGEFNCGHGAVYAIVTTRDTIFAGCQDGYVKVLDLETNTSVRSLLVEEGVDILSMSMISTDLYTCSADGQVRRWSASFDCTASWHAHDGIVLSSIICARNQWAQLLTGGSDHFIKVWEIPVPEYALSKFVAFPSISSVPSHREDCRQAAIWLKKCLNQLGATSSLLPNGEGRNPLVLATFSGVQNDKPKPRILFYGHYDVISAPKEGWESPPFVLTGKNGYLYGRGVTDDKGPILAVATAAAELLSRRSLHADLVFVIEGEEESGSGGFDEAVRKYRAQIGKIDVILVSNSTWIGEEEPCITYGLRGVVHCAVEITNSMPDVHSGVEGGRVKEPMLDMIKLLSTLVENGHVAIPGFYDSVRPVTDDEKALYGLLSSITKQPASSLSARWRDPSLTIHNIEVSGPGNATVIPSTVRAQISVRIVPDQKMEEIVQSLQTHLENAFVTLQSPNKLLVKIEHTADWWLGNLEDPYFQALENAVREEWGTEPLRIREGGSIPSVPWLEKEFGCHALHFPMGQSTDHAHLPNERIRLSNLARGKSVIMRFLTAIGTS
ncbi:hypothetical protein EV122DRAFT_201331 [Schizophyllum commune]